MDKPSDYKNVANNKASPAPLLSKSVMRSPPQNTVLVFRYLILAKPVCALFDHVPGFKEGGAFYGLAARTLLIVSFRLSSRAKGLH